MTEQTQTPAEPQGETPNPMMAMIDTFAWPAAVMLFNGIRTTLPQVPVGLILVRLSGLLGRALSQTTAQGDLSAILQLRAACIKEFTEGVRSTTPKPAPTPIKPVLNS